MAPKKLTEADKTSILSLYRQPQETTSTLAERYGVSNSTISRLLKASLPKHEYSVLIQQKRGVATDKAVVITPTSTEEAVPAVDKPRPKKSTPEPKASAPEAEQKPEPEAAAIAPAKPTRKRRSKSVEEPAVAEPTPEDPPEVVPEPAQLSLPDPAPAPEKPARPVLKSAQAAAAIAPEESSTEAEATPQAAADLDDDWDDDTILGDDYDDDGDDSDDDDDDDAYAWEASDSAARENRQRDDAANLGILEISPLTAEALPPLCYVVVERTSSELVVLPLRTFADLGQIPEAEGDSRTLPVFENHNVARRFSRRNQRVVKVPDGTLLQTTSPYLQAKGITRLLIDGQVFSLGEDSVEPMVPLGDE